MMVHKFEVGFDWLGNRAASALATAAAHDKCPPPGACSPRAGRWPLTRGPCLICKKGPETITGKTSLTQHSLAKFRPALDARGEFNIYDPCKWIDGPSKLRKPCKGPNTSPSACPTRRSTANICS